MIYRFMFFILTFSISTLFADPYVANPETLEENALSSLDNLIDSSRKNLENQSKLREDILRYKQLQQNYLQNTDEIVLLYRLIKIADRVLTNINDNHLADLFEREFIKDLTTLSNIAKKRGIPKA